MKFGLNCLLIFFALISLVTPEADATLIRKRYCAPTDVFNAGRLFTRYSEYSQMPGADYSVSLLGNDVSLISMVKSQTRQLPANGTEERAFVWIVMKPLRVTDEKLYPRFLLLCESSTSPDAFVQRCTQQSDRQHFGLKDLSIQIKVAPSIQCNARSSLVDLTIDIQGNPSEIGLIKSQVLAGAGPLTKVIEALFDEESFFVQYFENLYKNWVDLLRKS